MYYLKKRIKNVILGHFGSESNKKKTQRVNLIKLYDII